MANAEPSGTTNPDGSSGVSEDFHPCIFCSSCARVERCWSFFTHVIYLIFLLIMSPVHGSLDRICIPFRTRSADRVKETFCSVLLDLCIFAIFISLLSVILFLVVPWFLALSFFFQCGIVSFVVLLFSGPVFWLVKWLISLAKDDAGKGVTVSNSSNAAPASVAPPVVTSSFLASSGLVNVDGMSNSYESPSVLLLEIGSVGDIVCKDADAYRERIGKSYIDAQVNKGAAERTLDNLQAELNKPKEAGVSDADHNTRCADLRARIQDAQDALTSALDAFRIAKDAYDLLPVIQKGRKTPPPPEFVSQLALIKKMKTAIIGLKKYSDDSDKVSVYRASFLAFVVELNDLRDPLHLPPFAFSLPVPALSEEAVGPVVVEEAVVETPVDPEEVAESEATVADGIVAEKTKTGFELLLLLCLVLFLVFFYTPSREHILSAWVPGVCNFFTEIVGRFHF